VTLLRTLGIEAAALVDHAPKRAVLGLQAVWRSIRERIPRRIKAHAVAALAARWLAVGRLALTRHKAVGAPVGTESAQASSISADGEEISDALGLREFLGVASTGTGADVRMLKAGVHGRAVDRCLGRRSCRSCRSCDVGRRPAVVAAGRESKDQDREGTHVDFLPPGSPAGNCLAVQASSGTLTACGSSHYSSWRSVPPSARRSPRRRSRPLGRAAATAPRARRAETPASPKTAPATRAQAALVEHCGGTGSP
jgi:hypothetical protein